MREIVKVLLQEGIDEETIHEVLDVIEEGLNLNKVVYRAREKGKIDFNKGQELRKKAGAIPGTNDYHYNKEGKLEGEGSSKEESKNDKGKSKTDLRTAIKTNRSLYQIQRRRKQDDESGNEIAINKSERRHYDKTNK